MIKLGEVMWYTCALDCARTSILFSFALDSSLLNRVDQLYYLVLVYSMFKAL